MAEVVPQTDEQSLQQFLSDSPWDYQEVMDQVAGDVNQLLGGKDSALLLDESSIVKKGEHSVGVARQWCGRLGKVDNCQVGVFSALSKGSDVCLIDSELYLPKSWIENSQRCDKTRVPAEKREPISKLDIALTLVKRAINNKLDFGWVGADSFYGRDKKFQKELDPLGQTFVLDVPNDFRIYTHDPKPYLPSPSKTGRTPTRYKTHWVSLEAKQWAKQQGAKAYRAYTFRNGSKGPLKVEAIHQQIWVWDGRSAEANCWHHHMALIVMAMEFLLKQRAERKDTYPMLTVSDMVLIFSNILPSRMNNLRQVIDVIEQRHQTRRKDMHLKSQQSCHLQRWAETR